MLLLSSNTANNPNNALMKTKDLDQPSTIGPAFNNCDRSHVSRYTIPAEEGCMQGEIILSSVPPCSLNHPHVLWIIKKKNSFYGFTSQQPRYAFVKIGGKLEPYVNLNGRHLVVIRAVLRMMETHTGLFWGGAQWTEQHWLKSLSETFMKSEGFFLMNTLTDALTEDAYAVFMSRSLWWWTC